jgi:hypothetical protein
VSQLINEHDELTINRVYASNLNKFLQIRLYETTLQFFSFKLANQHQMQLTASPLIHQAQPLIPARFGWNISIKTVKDFLSQHKKTCFYALIVER